MSASASVSKVSPPAPRWRLWVDGCGGFLLLAGDHWSVGGMSHGKCADVCVRADWPRQAGLIERVGGDYFWMGSQLSDRRHWISDGQPIPIRGSAVLLLSKPSPLCDSAVLTLRAPHRFEGHVDGVVLAIDSLLVGPGSDCHIRYRESLDRAVLTRRGERWLARTGLSGDFEELVPGQRTTLRSLAMTLEQA